jgi:DNA-binding PadR family transcriptional regulator
MLTDSEQVADALRLLVDFDWLTTTTRTDTGGRPATTYTVNPRGCA